MTSPETATDTEGVGVVVVLMAAPTKEHCHARTPANLHEEKVAVEKVAEEEVEEVGEEVDDGLSLQQQVEVLVVV